MNSAKHLICEITDKDFIPGFVPKDLSAYHVRKAARCVLLGDKVIALLHVTKEGYHKFPGGGIEAGETNEDGLRRELLEETGCACEILDQSGIVLEYLDQEKKCQIDYVYLASVVGDVGHAHLEQDELDAGFALKWVSVSEAKALFAGDRPKSYEGKFINKRDSTILEFYSSKIAQR